MGIVSGDGRYVRTDHLDRATGYVSFTDQRCLKEGYESVLLEAVLSDVLGAGHIHRVVIVGAGLMGRALALHADFEEYGFKTVAILDVDPKIIGEAVGSVTVKPMTALGRIVKRWDVDIGIIAVPAAAAQPVADKLVAAGIRGLMNLAHTHLSIPDNIYVVEARLIARMQEIAYAIRSRK